MIPNGCEHLIHCDSYKKRGSTFVIITPESLDFNNFYISGNANESPLQVSCLLIYVT